MREALLTGDPDYLTLARVEALLEIIPSPEELETIAGHELPADKRLAETERYFLAVKGITRLERRLQASVILTLILTPLFNPIFSPYDTSPYPKVSKFQNFYVFLGRMQVMRIRHTFSGAISRIKQDLSDHDSLCDAIMSSTELRKARSPSPSPESNPKRPNPKALFLKSLIHNPDR